MDVTEVRKLDAYLKRVFGNQKIRVVPRPKKDDSAEVYIGEEFIGVLFVDDEDDDRSYQFQMAILETDSEEDEDGGKEMRPHPEERAFARVSKDGVGKEYRATRLMVRDAPQARRSSP